MNQEISEITIHAPELPEGFVWLNTPRPLSLRELRGHVVVLDFWTYCCVNCMHVLPVLRGVEARHAREPLVVIGVHSAKFDGERDPERIADAIARHDVRHPVIVDREMRVWNDFGVRSWPTLVVVRPNGTIAAVAPGEPDPDVLAAFIEGELERARARGALTSKPQHFAHSAPLATTPLRFPSKIDVATDGRIAVSDSGHHRVLVLDAEGGFLDAIGSGVVGWTDGAFEEAQLDDPQGIRWSASGKALYVTDARTHTVARARLDARVLETLAGTGHLATAPLRGTSDALTTPLRSPWDVIEVDDTLVVALAGSHQIATIAEIHSDRPERRRLALLAGTGAESIVDGPLVEATFSQPSGLARVGDEIFVADSETSAVRALATPARRDGRVRTIVGVGLFDFGDVDGPRDVARMQHCIGIAAAPDGALVVADTYNHKLKRVDPATGATTTFFVEHDGVSLREPAGVAWDPRRRAFLVADTGHDRIVEISADGGRARLLPITGVPDPRRGDARRLARRPPIVETDWFTSHVEAMGALGVGDGRIHVDVCMADGLHFAGRSTTAISLEVSRRSDLLVPDWIEASRQPPTEGDLVFEVPVRVESLPSDVVEAEITARIDVVACTEGGAGPAGCFPLRTLVRLPVRLSRDGGRALRFAVPVRRVG